MIREQKKDLWYLGHLPLPSTIVASGKCHSVLRFVVHERQSWQLPLHIGFSFEQR